MENENKTQCEQEKGRDIQDAPEISKEEMMAAESCGLKNIRRYGEKTYQLFDVAEKQNTEKCQYLLETQKQMKMEGTPCKIEEKAQVIALYIRIK